MADPDEDEILVMSEVHAAVPTEDHAPAQPRVQVVERARRPLCARCRRYLRGSTEPAVDEDGDLVVPRAPGELVDAPIASQCCAPDQAKVAQYTIQHTALTKLGDVGLQLWRGALLLGDFLVDRPDVCEGRAVLELGAGVGLVALVASGLGAHTTYVTDGPLGVLANCAVNMEQAPALQRPRVRQLDWLAGELPTAGEHRWAWGADDLAALPRITTYLAADVIYDDRLTDAFLDVAERCLATCATHDATLWLALERRIRFSLEDLDAVAPAYTHFQQELAQRRRPHAVRPLAPGGAEVRASLRAQQVAAAVPQYFLYDRSPELELWRLYLEHSV